MTIDDPRGTWQSLAACRDAWEGVVDIRPASDPRIEDWILIGDSGSIERAVRARAAWLAVEDLRIAASNFFKAYAQALLVPAFATLVSGGTLPDLSAANARVAIAYPGPRVLSLGWRPAEPADDAADGGLRVEVPCRVLVKEAIDEHLWPLIEGIRRSYHIAERVLRTSISYEIVAACRRVGRDGPLLDSALERASQVLAEAGAVLADTGWLVVEADGATRRVRFERATCCLKHRIPGKTNCVGCSLLRLERT